MPKTQEIKERLFAFKWFCQVAAEGVTIYWVFKHRTKTEHVVARVRQCLGNVPATIGPTAKIAVDLPLSRGSLTFVDRLLPSVQTKKGPEEDVVGLADWMLGEDGNPTPADVQQKEEVENHYQRDLLSIAVQFASGSLKHRFWRVITGFFEGRESLPLNTALLLSARILFFEGLPADTAKSILLDYCRSIPNPTSSRLTDSTRRHVLEKDIRRAVEGVYQDNGRQQDAETSTQKMRAVATAWRSKGLVFLDKTTWNLTYGYVAVPKVSFTEQERQNIKAYLLPLLSSRDAKGQESLEVAVHLADCIVRLVSAKEKQGTGLATSYLQQYIKGETGICCQNKTKFGKIKEALIALGFIKVLRQGRHRCGATYYGLAGRLAEKETPCENRTPVNEDKIDTIIMPIEEQVEEYGNQRDLLSIAVQIPDSRPRRVLRLTSDPVFNRLLSQSQELQKPKPATLFTSDPVFNRLIAKSLASDPPWS